MGCSLGVLLPGDLSPGIANAKLSERWISHLAWRCPLSMQRRSDQWVPPQPHQSDHADDDSGEQECQEQQSQDVGTLVDSVTETNHLVLLYRCTSPMS